jgi:hypothetical protein
VRYKWRQYRLEWARQPVGLGAAARSVRYVGRKYGLHRLFSGGLLLRLRRHSQALVDEWQDATTRDRRADEDVELLVATDRELQMARGDAFHAQVLRRVP